MATKLSRRKISSHVAKQILAGDGSAIDNLAALLVDEGRQREAELIVKDIESELTRHGELVVTVEAARPVDETVRAEIKQMFEGKQVHIREVIRPELIGGVRISTPTSRLDASLARKIADLRAIKIDEEKHE